MNHMISLKRPLLEPLIKSEVDGIIVPLEGLSMRQSDYVPISALKNTIERIKASGKIAWVNINAIFHQNELPAIKSAMEIIRSSDVDGILFADLAVYEYAARLGLTDKLVYYPETYVTSDEDVRFWSEEGIKSVVAAREMTLEDIQTMAATNALPLSIVGHGYINMFHSKRKLLKTFFKYSKVAPSAPVNNSRFNLVESMHDDVYPVQQDAFGTHIFRASPLKSFDVYEELRTIVDTLIIDTQFYANETIMGIVEDYARKRAGETVQRAYSDHDTGFYFKKTVYTQSKEGLQ